MRNLLEPIIGLNGRTVQMFPSPFPLPPSPLFPLPPSFPPFPLSTPKNNMEMEETKKPDMSSFSPQREAGVSVPEFSRLNSGTETPASAER